MWVDISYMEQMGYIYIYTMNCWFWWLNCRKRKVSVCWEFYSAIWGMVCLKFGYKFHWRSSPGNHHSYRLVDTSETPIFQGGLGMNHHPNGIPPHIKMVLRSLTAKATEKLPGPKLEGSGFQPIFQGGIPWSSRWVPRMHAWSVSWWWWWFKNLAYTRIHFTSRFNIFWWSEFSPSAVVLAFWSLGPWYSNEEKRT